MTPCQDGTYSTGRDDSHGFDTLVGHLWMPQKGAHQASIAAGFFELSILRFSMAVSCQHLDSCLHRRHCGVGNSVNITAAPVSVHCIFLENVCEHLIPALCASWFVYFCAVADVAQQVDCII